MPDPFDTLGLPARFALDREALEARHRELSRTLHPDRHAGATPAERRHALGKAIEVNEAFRALRDPVQRAEALLRRRGLAVGEGAREPAAPPALLMEVMESREALAEARRLRDPARLSALADAERLREAAVQARLTALLDEGGSGAPPDAALAAVGELRYRRRFLEEVAAIEDELL